MAGGLRVIAGSAKGIELKRPASGRTRPTAGRLREALFSMLEAMDADFSRVLDLYAGSGALGIEALSRGDGTATFVESDRRTADVIRENLRRAGLADRANVWAARVERWRPEPDDRYTLVLADPPYAQASEGRSSRGGDALRSPTPYDGAAPWAAIQAAVQDALDPSAVVVVEHDARHDPPGTLAGLPLWRDRRHGAGAVSIYRRSEKEEDQG